MNTRTRVGVLATLLSLVAVAFPPPAQAATQIVARKQVSVWARDVKVWVPSDVLIPSSFNMRVVVNTVYWYWPQETAYGNSKVGMIRYGVCYTMLDGARGGVLFNGVKADPYYFDADTITDPASVSAGDDGIQNCDSTTIPVADRVWLRLDQAAAWTATGWVKWTAWPDQEFQWKNADGSRVRFFDPADDLVLEGWTTMDKPW